MKESAKWSADKSRRVNKRIIVQGELVLQEPAHFGGDAANAFSNMALLVDATDGESALLPGSTITGALRSYLSAREFGYRDGEEQAPAPGYDSLTVTLFGGAKQDEKGPQSALIVDESYASADEEKATSGLHVEMREGVRLRGASRTADDKGLFDAEYWAAGTTFLLRLELVVCEPENTTISAEEHEKKLRRALATALEGFEKGEIPIGMRKSRGFGKASVDKWQVTEYDFSKPEHLVAWIEGGAGDVRLGSIASALDVNVTLQDRRKLFRMAATFGIDGSLLIRSGSGSADVGPDAVHLHRRNGANKEPVVSGTSLAGALRARARYIASCIGPEKAALVEQVYGSEPTRDDENKRLKASRLQIREAVIENAVTDLVQNRVSIDRFTGGALHSALFNEQPAFGKPETSLTIECTILNPNDAEIGLLLLLLKDLWTGDLPVGGEQSIGRGRLSGKSAKLIYRNGSNDEWTISRNGDKLVISGNPDRLEQFVKALNSAVR